MIKRMWVVSVLAIVAVFMTAVFAQADQKTDELIAKLEAKSKNIHSYRANMAMNMEMMGQQMVSTGKMVFKEPNKSRTDMNTKMGKMDMKQIMISDGKTTWMYSPTMNIVQKMDLEKIIAETGNDDPTGQQGNNLSNLLQGLKRESILYVRTENMDGGKVYVFQGNPQDVKTEKVPFVPGKMEIWLSADDGMPRKMVMFNQEGKEIMSQIYSNIEVNVDIPDSQFEFTPPEGIQVMDITESTINMMKQMKGKGEE